MSYILGLGGPYYHDASACLIDDTGHIVAFVEEERFTRRKHNKDSRSASNAAAYCLGQAGIRLDQVDEIAVSWNPNWPNEADYITDPDLIRELLDPTYFGGHTPARLTIVEHHLAHAASAFYPSGYPSAAVLAVDGSGDGISTSLYHGTSAGLRLLRQFPFTQSLGWFYETVAEHLGLGDWTSSGKLMGLAAYGRPTYGLDFIRIGYEDGYLFDLTRYGLSPQEDARDDYLNLAYYRRLKHAYARAFTELGVPPHRRDRRYDDATSRIIADGAFTPAQANLAASAQQTLEHCLLQLARSAIAHTDSTRLCVAGGVGLNCSANGVLHRHSGASELFVQPAAGDAGCAIGSALECLRRAGHLTNPGPPMASTALGPSFDDKTILATLDSYELRHTYYGEDIAAPIAQAIAAGSTIGWFQGPTECGPRALGHRSILASPRTPATRDHINRDIKHREMWRPLAPSILDTALKDFVDVSGPADFMIVAHTATDHARAAIPATVHVDGSLRPQAVREATNRPFARLLRAVEAETGVPVVLNTSFNNDTEPIVCTPTDALRTYFSTSLDALALGGYLLTKDA